MTEPTFLIIDLFCGAGGTTTGFALAEQDGESIAKVIACVNHDPKAIESHWKNHPEVMHFEEDVRTLNLSGLVKVVNKYRRMYPHAKVVLWASLECTNFSKAKGGLPREADSRTLAYSLYMKWNAKNKKYVQGDSYIQLLKPDYVQIENVVEFRSWGEMDENGKPVSRKNGIDWILWKQSLCALGYRDDWTEMNSANFGAYTSRNRLFGIFAKGELPICWPEFTHAKNPEKYSLYGCSMKKWKPVKEVLNFTDEGESIFQRKKDLSEKTLERVYAGLIKYVAHGDASFISKYYSGKPEHKNISVDGPAGSVTTIDGQALVQVHPIALLKYNSTDKNGNHFPPSLESPSPVVTTQGRLGLIQGEFIVQRNSGKAESKLVNVEGPARTITATGGNQELVQPEFLVNYNLVEAEPFIVPTNYDNQPKSIDEPLQTITANRKHHYLVNPSWYGNSGSVDEPCCVIVARQDKAPLYFVQAEEGKVAIAIFEGDSPVTIKIKKFMAAYGLVDIKMRMLRVLELLRIQGFPDDYHLAGNQADQKKFIGNSVVPKVVKAWAESLALKLLEFYQNKKVA